jgi:hypothetical protein
MFIINNVYFLMAQVPTGLSMPSVPGFEGDHFDHWTYNDPKNQVCILGVRNEQTISASRSEMFPDPLFVPLDKSHRKELALV